MAASEKQDKKYRSIFEKKLYTLEDALYSFAETLTLDKDIVKDLVQETLLKAQGKNNGYKDGINVLNWLFSILMDIFKYKYDKDNDRLYIAYYEEIAAFLIENKESNPIFNKDFNNKGVVKIIAEIPNDRIPPIQFRSLKDPIRTPHPNEDFQEYHLIIEETKINPEKIYDYHDLPFTMSKNSFKYEFLLNPQPRLLNDVQCTIETIYAKILEIEEHKVIVRCLLDEEKKAFQIRKFDKAPLLGAVTLEINQFLEIKIYTQPGERRFTYQNAADPEKEKLFEPEKYFEGLDDSPFFNTLQSKNENNF